MKYVLQWIFSLVLLTGVAGGEEFLYLASGDTLGVYAVHPEAGTLRLHQSVELPGVGPFTFSHDGATMYAMVGGRKTPSLATLERKPDGTMSLLHQAPVNFFSGYLKVDHTGAFLAGHSYLEGLAVVWKLEGGIYKGTAVQELKLEPKAHSAVFSSDNRWLLVPATSPNKVFVNAFDAATGKLTPNNPPFAVGPEGDEEARHPRHLIFHPHLSEIIYTTNEHENPGVCVWKWNGDAGTLKPIQNIVTVSDQAVGRVTASTLHLTPDARFLYIATRNFDRKTKTGNSSIVGFRVNPADGSLSVIGHTPCENVPRTFCIDASGRFLYVAGQHDQKMGVYAIDQKTGGLQKIEQHQIGKAPAWMETR